MQHARVKTLGGFLRDGLRWSNRPLCLADLLVGISRAILLAVIIVTPWLFAGVEAETQVWLFLAVAAAALCFLLSTLLPSPRSSSLGSAALPWVTIVPLLALGLGLLQLTPMDHRIVAVLSPNAARLHDDLATMTPAADAALERHFPTTAGEAKHALSLYPASSRRELALLALAAAIFVLGTGLFRSPRPAWCSAGCLPSMGPRSHFFSASFSR